MKLRIGFVSNSSSSSFCIAKTFMTTEQISDFAQLSCDIEENSDGTHIDWDKNYFMGSVDNYDFKRISDFFDKSNLSKFVGHMED